MKKRILALVAAMVMVIGLHFFGHGGGLSSNAWSYNYFISQTVYVFLFIAVNCFVLISGYYLCTSQFKLKKIVNLWIQVAFYSVAIYLIVSLIQGNFEMSELIKSGMVVTLKQYWFFTAYFFLYLIFPFLNYAIKAMTQRAHFICCAVLFTLFSVLPTFIYLIDFSQVRGGYSFVWFVVLYMVAAYVRIYVPKNCMRKRTALVIIYRSWY